MPKHKRFYFAIPFFVLAALAVVSAIVMYLWNEVLTAVVPVKRVNYVQAAGLLILCKILFSSFRPGPGGFRRGGHWKHKLMDLSAEEREQFRREWQQRHTPPADTNIPEK